MPQSPSSDPANPYPYHLGPALPPHSTHLKTGGVALILVLLPHNLVVQRDALRLAPPHAVAERAARKAAVGVAGEACLDRCCTRSRSSDRR